MKLELNEHVDICPCCGSKKQLPFWQGIVRWSIVENLIKMEYVHCPKCDVVYLVNRMSDKATREFYTNDYRNVVEQAKDYSQDMEEARQKQRVQVLLKIFQKTVPDFIPHLSLDIGCDVGHMLDGMRNLWHTFAVGVEWNTNHLMQAVNKGYKIYEDIPDVGSYSLVTSLHVLEHMNEPLKELKKIRKLLRAGGYMIIEVPNREVHTGAYRPVHCLAFNAVSLQNLVQKAGFKVIVTFTYQGILTYPLGYYLAMIVQKEV